MLYLISNQQLKCNISEHYINIRLLLLHANCLRCVVWFKVYKAINYAGIVG